MQYSTQKTQNERIVKDGQSKQYKAYGLHNFHKIPQIQRLSDEQKFEIEVVGSVLPFKTNNYVVDELIDWDNLQEDPIYTLTFPQRDMLEPQHFERMASVMASGACRELVKETANEIRLQLNPHPAGQMEHNVPTLDGEPLPGIQHKYRETALFFPSQGQTCHAYCTFCFRWPQFVGMDNLKFATKEADSFVRYAAQHPEITDVLITGGDPLIMRAKTLAKYLDPIVTARDNNVQTIRIGTKALGYWPYKFFSDPDAPELMDIFKRIVDGGKHLAIMAHFNHPQEMQTEAVQQAIAALRNVGVEIRTQSPIMRHINDNPDDWSRMWRLQVKLGCIPYYMFLARDTGAQRFFSVPLVRAWRIFQAAYQSVSGLARTVRGPSMSSHPGKVEVLGVTEIAGEKVLTLRMLQGRNPDWVLRPFFAELNENAVWLDDLKPAFGQEKFFFEEELDMKYGVEAVETAVSEYS